MDDPPTPSCWLKAHELPMNLLLMGVTLALFIVGMVSGQGLVAGPALILLIFFATYSIYAYVRRDLGG